MTTLFAIAACAQVNAGCSSPPQALSAVTADAWTRITGGLNSFLDQVEALDAYPPGTAVVVVAGAGRRYIRVHGETQAGSQPHLT
jgi:hypothetical protein